MSWTITMLVLLLAVTTPLAAVLAGERVAQAHPLLASANQARSLTAGLQILATRAAGPATEVATDVALREARSAGALVAGQDPAPTAHLLVHVPDRGLIARARPRASASVVGTVAPSSKYYHVPIVAWVEATRRGWGRVELPYVWPRVDGWIALKGLDRERSWITVRVDLSAHRIRLDRRGRTLATFPAATGTSSSPTPPGEYFVTDRVPFSAGSALGSFAFGISGIQPRLPVGWSGGNQLAIHGTNAPWSIGTSASAGCVRVSETALHRLLPLLKLGTPVLIHA